MNPISDFSNLPHFFLILNCNAGDTDPWDTTYNRVKAEERSLGQIPVANEPQRSIAIDFHIKILFFNWKRK
jgi:hypothetical protein